MAPGTEKLAAQHDGLTIYLAGMPTDATSLGYLEDFSRDPLEAAITADDPEMIHDQLIFGNLHQAQEYNPLTAAEKYKYHHQLPGVVVHRGLRSDYCATDADADYFMGHAFYERATGDRTLTERFKSNLIGAVEVYTFSHINSRTHQFEEDPKYCLASDFALDRTDWKDSYTPKRDKGKVIYPAVFPNIQAKYMKGLRDISQTLNIPDYACEADKMKQGLQALFDEQTGNFYIAVDKLGPIPGVSSDGLNNMAYLELEDLEPRQWEAIIRSSQVLETVAGYLNIDPEIAKTMADDYHTRVWPKEDANIRRGARKLQQRAKEEGLLCLADAFGHVMDVSLRTASYLDTAPETLKVHEGMVEKAGCDPQLWTVTAKQYFRSVLLLKT